MQTNKECVENWHFLNHEPGKNVDFSRPLVEGTDADAYGAVHVVLCPIRIASFSVYVPFPDTGMVGYVGAFICHVPVRNRPGWTVCGTDFAGFAKFDGPERTK